ncbi:MAG: hypothetical protein V4696_03470 [Pseudomonadota bacterium]
MPLLKLFADDSEQPRRALIELPRWDAKVLLAAGFFAGYYYLVARLIGRTEPMPADVGQLVRDALLVLGPAIGVIVGATWRTTISDERSAARRSEDLRTAIETPSAPPALPAPGPELRRDVRAGTRAGVNDALADVAADDEGTEIIR